MNYTTIKELAKENGRRVTDLIALAPQNDPFYAGTPGDWTQAQWFADLWQRFGYGAGVHLRRVHYQVISQSQPVIMPNGLPYENTELCWGILSQASKNARYLNLVDPGSFVDRRNPEPKVYTNWADAEPSTWVYDNLWQAISGELEAQTPDLDDYPIPAASPASEKDGALYDSERGYLQQIDCYKEFQGKE